MYVRSVSLMKILVANLGNPKIYNEQTYIFNGVKSKSKTSLELLKENINPDKIILIAPLTLAKKGSCVEDIYRDAKENIYFHIDLCKSKNVKVLIAPAVGHFSNGSFLGNALDYYYYILYYLSLELLKLPSSSLEVHVDLTYGINYTTILTYRALKELLEVLAIFRSVCFKAYNTDPFSPSNSSINKEELNINIIENIDVVTPRAFGYKIKNNHNPLLLPSSLSSDKKKELFQGDLKCIKELDHYELSTFLGAFYNGLPLAVFTWFPDLKLLDKVIKECIAFHKKFTIISTNNNKLYVKYQCSLTDDFRCDIFAYLIASNLKNHNLIDSRVTEVPLEKIKELNNKIFHHNKVHTIRTSRDIERLEKIAPTHIDKTWKSYNKILSRGICNLFKKNIVRPPDQRNFLAHSGLEWNAIEIACIDGKKYVRYDSKRWCLVFFRQK